MKDPGTFMFYSSSVLYYTCTRTPLQPLLVLVYLSSVHLTLLPKEARRFRLSGGLSAIEESGLRVPRMSSRRVLLLQGSLNKPLLHQRLKGVFTHRLCGSADSVELAVPAQMICGYSALPTHNAVLGKTAASDDYIETKLNSRILYLFRRTSRHTVSRSHPSYLRIDCALVKADSIIRVVSPELKHDSRQGNALHLTFDCDDFYKLERRTGRTPLRGRKLLNGSSVFLRSLREDVSVLSVLNSSMVKIRSVSSHSDPSNSGCSIEIESIFAGCSIMKRRRSLEEGDERELTQECVDLLDQGIMIFKTCADAVKMVYVNRSAKKMLSIEKDDPTEYAVPVGDCNVEEDSILTPTKQLTPSFLSTINSCYTNKTPSSRTYHVTERVGGWLIDVKFHPLSDGRIMTALTGHKYIAPLKEKRVLPLEEQQDVLRMIDAAELKACVSELDSTIVDLYVRTNTQIFADQFWSGKTIRGKWSVREMGWKVTDLQWWMGNMYTSMKQSKPVRMVNSTVLIDERVVWVKMECHYVDSIHKETGEHCQLTEPSPDHRHRFIQTFTDVTETKRLEDMNALQKQVLDLTDDILMSVVEPTTDEHIRYHLLNRRAQETLSKVYNITHDDLIGRTSRDLGVDSQHVKMYRDLIVEAKNLMKGRRALYDPYTLMWYICSVYELPNNRYAILCADVTEIKCENDNLEVVKHALEKEVIQRDAALIGQSRFLSTMSHEIRTPLSGIIETLCHFSEKSSLGESDQEILSIGRICSDQLLNVINDILDYSKIEANELVLEMKPLLVQGVLEESMDMVKLQGAKKGLDVICWPDIPTGFQIVADYGRLRQIMVNLLSNAIKFTEKGEIQVHGCLHPSNSSIQISVRDTGIGISEAFKHTMFRPFVQSDSSITRRYGGTGLGLSISKRFVEAMGGCMWLESIEGRGTTFHLTLPCSVVTPEDSVVEARQISLMEEDITRFNAMRPTLIMIIDANVNQSMGLTRWLNRLGYHCVTYVSMDEALRDDKSLPAIIIVDQMTREGDTDRLSENHPRASLLLCESLNVNPSATSQSVYAIIRKPYRKRNLLSVFFRQMRRQSIMPTEIVRPVVQVSQSLSPKLPTADEHMVVHLKVMVAEDNALNQKVIVRMLSRYSIEPLVVDNGKKAVDAARCEDYDLILMDCNMPECGGIEATRLIRKLASPKGHRPTIVALTADAMASNRQRCLDSGMDEVMLKPIRREELHHVLLSAQHLSDVAKNGEK
ncbi:integral membrane sensor hybrid histidine kinase [Planoprotostelium fungivorum]|uniref:Integral membrane sensor hybrid histidine kinase n=1 Tax=Planoprotostelium fungivorum TaxID=1890364 RepID=A0A2P6NAK0_9EUKA|nr:integral membrane sensor hybrid histidine kinase [Planoprotostelium fungivorum]